MAIGTVNPSTGQLLKSFESLNAAEIETRLQRSADTFRSYRTTSFGDRARWMLNAAAVGEQEKMGKTFRCAVDEVAKCAWSDRGKAAGPAGKLLCPDGPGQYSKKLASLSGRTVWSVASVFRAKDIDDAIRIANDSRFGLGASAWSNELAEQEKFVNELEAGMVFINRMVRLIRALRLAA